MKGRIRELAEREAELQLRCAVQRSAIATEVANIEARFETVDRAASLTRRFLTNPIVVTGGVVALLTLGRVGGIRLVGRAVLLMTAARRLLQALKTL